MKLDSSPHFLRDFLIDAQVIESDCVAQASARPPMPWHWPTGSRRLLAGLVTVGAAAITFFGSGRHAGDLPPRPAPNLILDANTAPARVLGALPHVGPALVRKWTAAREIRPFESMEDLQARVKGLGPVGINRIAPHVRIENVPSASGPIEPPKRIARKRTPKRVAVGKKVNDSPVSGAQTDDQAR